MIFRLWQYKKFRPELLEKQNWYWRNYMTEVAETASENAQIVYTSEKIIKIANDAAN